MSRFSLGDNAVASKAIRHSWKVRVELHDFEGQLNADYLIQGTVKLDDPANARFVNSLLAAFVATRLDNGEV